MVVVTVGEIKAEPVYQLYLYRKIVSVLNSSLLFRYCFERFVRCFTVLARGPAYTLYVYNVKTQAFC